MIFLFLALQAAAASPGVDGTPVGALATQDLPNKGCAAYLWSAGGDEHQLVAMASAEAAQLRITLGGRVIDLARVSQDGAGGFGFAGGTGYAAGDVSATLDLVIETAASLTGGARVPEATLTVEQAGRDTVVMPVAGLIGCAAA